MESSAAGLLVGSEIHGFNTLHDLDVGNMMEEAKMRWLRPNEIHAILCNYKHFTINAKPITLPKSGTAVLFNRKMLRNFRKDGLNWKKKKDGKTVKEAHEHLKVGNNERIHVYYAHGQDNSTFVRRCYWLLDKKLEHIVLVHYRETQELQGSPTTPLNSNSNSNSSSVSDPSAPWLLSEELDSGANHARYVGEIDGAVSTEPGDNLTVKNHEIRLHELNTLEWDELVTKDVATIDSSNFKQQDLSELGLVYDSGLSHGASSLGALVEPVSTMGVHINPSSSESNFVDFSHIDGLQGQDSLGKWMNYIITETQFPNSVDDLQVTSSHSSGYYDSSPLTVSVDNQQSSLTEFMFRITDVAPTWAYSTEKTKILITGIFNERHFQQEISNLFCVCGDLSVPVEFVQGGGFRCWVPPHRPGLVGLYLSFDGHKPISQVIDFEYRAPLHDVVLPTEEKPKLEELKLQTRLAFLLFTTSKCLDIASSKISLDEQKEEDAKKFALHTANITKDWAYLLSSVEDNRTSFLQAKETAFELMLKNRLKDWILERVIAGCKTSEFDIHGQSVIHLCAILGYTWSVELFSWSGLSLDFRDKFGWTALHWAACCGREKMIAKLLSAGAKPNLVTDPTSKNPSGCTAADLASKKGFQGLSAYLAEKALVQHFEDMSLAGNISGSLETTTNDATPNHENLTEEESYLKDSLAAYRTAAEAAARIQSAFRENSLKIRTKQVQHLYEEDEARGIIAALRIQHAFRNYESKKKLKAAARIQYTFRTWKMRREFLNMRKQAIRIQAVFRGYQVRRQHQKILWSVGVVEKAILRWRLKRKGFRGLEIKPVEETVHSIESDTEEDFFRTSRRQAEERLDRSVVTVQAMFRSKKAQEEYRRMKLAHDEAKLEYDEIHDRDNNMER